MKISSLVDANVLIDVVGDPGLASRPWSVTALKQAFNDGPIIFSAVVWAELASPAVPDEILARAFEWLRPRREDFPFAAAYAAGLAHRRYRMNGGSRNRTLPDFLIGAHALVGGHRLLTRDASRYRTYFPELEIIAPETHP